MRRHLVFTSLMHYNKEELKVVGTYFHVFSPLNGRLFLFTPVARYLFHRSTKANGFSVIETLIAAGVLMIFITATSQFAIIWKRNNDVTKTSSTVIALESAILSAIASPSTYNNQSLNERLTNDRAKKVLVSSISGEDFTLNLDEGLGNGITALPVGSKVFLNEDLEVCGKSFKDRGCLISIEVRFRRVNNEYRFGYDVSTNPKLMLPSHSTVKTETLADGTTYWADESFIVPIPQLYYRHNESSVGDCSPTSTIGITGINRETGDVQCLNILGGGCGAGFPIGISASGGKLKLTCSGPPALSYCPTNYAISRFSPLGNATASPDSACRRVIMLNSPGPSYGGAEGDNYIFGEACPPTTISRSTCVPVTVRGIVGTCVPLSCTAWVPDASWVDDGDPDTLPNERPNILVPADCSPLSITRGTTSLVEDGRDVYCTYTPPLRQETCEDQGGISSTFTDYVGAARLNINCRTTLPDTP